MDIDGTPTHTKWTKSERGRSYRSPGDTIVYFSRIEYVAIINNPNNASDTSSDEEKLPENSETFLKYFSINLSSF